MGHTIQLQAIDIPLVDPHFWTIRDSVRVAQLCDVWGLAQGSHSSSHFDMSLTMFTHTTAAIPDSITAISTHQVQQEAKEHLTRELPRIQDGHAAVSEHPGLGIRIDVERAMAARTLYKTLGPGARDDAVAMRYPVPSRAYGLKRPSLGR